MKSEEVPAAAMANQLELAELALPMEYGINFDWGSVRVTPSAHKAYELTLLTPNVVSNPTTFTRRKKSKMPDVEIVVVGPDELDGGDIDEDGHGYEHELYPYNIHAESKRKKRSIAIVLGMRESAGEIRSQLGNVDVDQAEEMFEYLLPNVVGDVPILESLKNEVPHGISVGLATIADAITQRRSRDVFREQMDKKFLKNLVVIGGLATVFAASISVPEAITRTPLESSALIVPCFAELGYLALGYWRVRGHLNDRELIDNRATMMARQFSLSVTDDFHSAYCYHQFNAEAEKLLDRGPGHPDQSN